MAFGAVRAGYSAPCKFFADDLPNSNRINWYIVPDDTPVFEGPTVFWPRVDTPLVEATSTHELEGVGRFVRRFRRRPRIVPPIPHDIHGDEQDFLGRSPRAKFSADGDAPAAPCVLTWIEDFGWSIGFRSEAVERFAFEIGFKSVPVILADHDFGFEIGFKSRKPFPPLPGTSCFDAGELEFGDTITVPLPLFDFVYFKLYVPAGTSWHWIITRQVETTAFQPTVFMFINGTLHLIEAFTEIGYNAINFTSLSEAEICFAFTPQVTSIAGVFKFHVGQGNFVIPAPWSSFGFKIGMQSQDLVAIALPSLFGWKLGFASVDVVEPPLVMTMGLRVGFASAAIALSPTPMPFGLKVGFTSIDLDPPPDPFILTSFGWQFPFTDYTPDPGELPVNPVFNLNWSGGTSGYTVRLFKDSVLVFEDPPIFVFEYTGFVGFLLTSGTLGDHVWEAQVEDAEGELLSITFTVHIV